MLNPNEADRVRANTALEINEKIDRQITESVRFTAARVKIKLRNGSMILSENGTWNGCSKPTLQHLLLPALCSELSAIRNGCFYPV